MKAIIGLGNPGEQYRLTRHNVGFLTLDHLAAQAGIAVRKRGFDALYGTGKIGVEPVLLAKPQTYMNVSGLAVEKLVSYFTVDSEDLIIIHDDLDLPFATLRLKAGGGEGGHKGLHSIMQCLGTTNFLRMRIGIGKPIHKTLTDQHVLSPFTEEEREHLPQVVAAASDAVALMVKEGIQSAMQRYHSRNGT